MLDSEKMAIAAHLHVLLRRLVGRVTDVEWMVRNRDYAVEVVRVSLAEPHPDLHVWARKLEAALQPAQPVAATVAMPPAARVVPRPTPAVDPRDVRESRFGFAPAQPPKRYVGSLR